MRSAPVTLRLGRHWFGGGEPLQVVVVSPDVEFGHDEPSAESLWLALRIERKSGQKVAEQSFANQLRRRYPGSPEYQALQRGNFD